MKTIFLSAAVALFALVPATSWANGQAELTRAIIAFGRGDAPGAKKLLDAAEDAADSDEIFAQIARQRGIIAHAEGDRTEAVLQFLKTSYWSDNVTLSDKEHKGEVVRLFECADALHDAGISESAARLRYASAFATADWTCPAGAPEPDAGDAALADRSAELTIAPELEAPDEGGGVPVWVWIVGGVLVAGGAAAGAVALTSGGELNGGTTGVVIDLSGGNDG